MRQILDCVAAPIRKEPSHSAANSCSSYSSLSIEPDYDYDDGWIVYVTWEIPVPTDDEWPLAVLDGYSQRTRDTVGDAGTTHCMFRTPDEMSGPSHIRGALLQPA